MRRSDQPRLPSAPTLRAELRRGWKTRVAGVVAAAHGLTRAELVAASDTFRFIAETAPISRLPDPRRARKHAR